MSEPIRVTYGPDAAQFGELYRPASVVHPGTVVIVHGGFWRARYELDLGRPLAADLADHGFTCWNVEYRRVGNGGGWPTTFADVAAAVDRLAGLDVDTSAVVTVGHSAGGQLAVWAAGRPVPGVPVTAAVAQAGVLDLDAAVRQRLGDAATVAFLGGTPEEAPDRYAFADPLRAVPLAAPVLCVHARGDDTVPIEQSVAYVTAARRSGGRAMLREVSGDHFTVIDPADDSWRFVRASLPLLLAGRLPA
jgi:acetyl esterase/lipase